MLLHSPRGTTMTRHLRLHALSLALGLAGALAATALPAAAAGPATVEARPAGSAPMAAYEGVVEAVRQTVVAAPVSGAIVELVARVGDRVAPGQLLLRIDARAAEQGAAAGEAQVQAARAALQVATQEFGRQQKLHEQQFISLAALQRAEAEFKVTQAQVNAQLAQAGVARTQSGLHVVRAPFAGVVAEVPVALGDMALPGRPLLTLYDPAALRVTASLPQSALPPGADMRSVRVQLPGVAAAAAGLAPTAVQLLPTADPATHTVQLRADLPALAGVTPGMFARLWLPAAARPGTAVSVPWQAVLRRAEITGLYVLDPQGRALLRQVRLGRRDGDRVEVLAGLSAGERVVADAQAALP